MSDGPAPTGPVEGTAVLATVPLGFQWPTLDPFLFCVHHEDAYPAANGRYGPDAPLTGRNPGADFEGRDGWRMYHGSEVPGFPQHPHRGFETVTIARRGLIDHADSLGAVARFGRGDVQWITAGNGLVHSEMFPLLDRDGPNPVELFQIWLNLPAEDQLADPHFEMLWEPDLPRVRHADGAGRVTEVTLVAGALDGHEPPPPPPRSWAARADTDVAIWLVDLPPGAAWTLPPARPGTARTLYGFAGGTMTVDGHAVELPAGVQLSPTAEVELVAGGAPVECLLLQGRPIGEPVAQYGPFVLTDEAGVRRAFEDYRRTGFGGWPWDRDDPVHGPDPDRFARLPDGTVVVPQGRAGTGR